MNTQIPYIRIAVSSHRRVRTYQVRLSTNESNDLKERFKKLDELSIKRMKNDPNVLGNFNECNI